ncbi:MAG TPA: hypothetical protein VF235_01540 [Actinomycetota bacterium]
MLRKHRAYALEDGGRPHRRVVTNLLAMQARLRGDVVVPVHPSARVLPDATPAGSPAVDEALLEEASIAPVLALPGAAAAPVRNPGTPDVQEALLRLEELEVRLEGLHTELFALVDRLEPGGGPAGRGHGTPEDAIVRLQRLIDRRLGSS